MNKFIYLYDFYFSIIPIKRLIIQASDIDGKDINNNKYPIGLSYSFFYLTNKEKLLIQKGTHKKLVLCSFSLTTDSKRRYNQKINRFIINNNLKKNGINNYRIDYKKYIKNISNFKFIISPEGNGIDCHRHYEALICGCIPIVEENELIKKKYNNLPVLFTKDYTEINEEYLSKKYKEMIKKKYEFNRLLIDYYSKEEQIDIKKKCYYWYKKL